MNRMKFRLNFVDILLAVLIFFTICMLMASFFTKEGINDLTNKEKYEITVSVKDVPKEYISSFNEGKILYISNSEKYFGTVKSVTATAQSVILDSGMYKSKDLYNLIIVVNCMASDQNNAVTVSGVSISSGSIIDMSVPEYFSYGKIVNIKKVEE